MNHKGTNTIETNRLILRKFEIHDAEAMYKNWATDRKVSKFLSWEPHESVEFTRNLLTTWVDAYQNNNVYNWVIDVKDENEIIGNISAFKIDELNYSCEIGYCISSKYWNKGITTEAVKGVIDYLFREVGFDKIIALYDTNNVASGKVMIKCNMQYEGTLKKAGLRKNNEIYDLARYAILKMDWDNLYN